MAQSVGEAGQLSRADYSRDLHGKGEIADEAVFGVYYHFLFVFPVVSELSDNELRDVAFKSGSYDFWCAEDENLYTLDDGEPV